MSWAQKFECLGCRSLAGNAGLEQKVETTVSVMVCVYDVQITYPPLFPTTE